MTRLRVFVLTAFLTGAALSQTITPGAEQLLIRRVTDNQKQYFVYRNSDDGINKANLSGIFPLEFSSYLRINTACVDDVSQSKGCSPNPAAQDCVRGTTAQFTIDPLPSSGFVGLNAVPATAAALDLTGVKNLIFEVRTPLRSSDPNAFQVQWGFNGSTTPFMTVPQSDSFQTVTIDLRKLTPPITDLTKVSILFSFTTNVDHLPASGAVLLVDNIRLDPVPPAQASVLSLPVSTGVCGISQATNTPFPLDQILSNPAAVYDASIAARWLMQSSNPAARDSAKRIVDALVYALSHDSSGLPIPPAADGSGGHALRSAYRAGDLALLANQIQGGLGKQGEVQLAGFTGGSTVCGDSGYCLVLDNVAGGNNAFAILALYQSYFTFNDTRYRDAAISIAKWIRANLRDTSGYGGYFNGYDDDYNRKIKVLNRGKSTENAADLFAAFLAVANLDPANSAEWTDAAYAAGDYVMSMYVQVDSSTGHFYAGTVPAGTVASDGIQPDPSTLRGGEVINVADFTDADTFPLLAMAAHPRYRAKINWRLPIVWVLSNMKQTVAAGSLTYTGFGLTPTAGSSPGIAWEFTAQVALALRYADFLYGENTNENQAELLISQLRQAQVNAPFTDGQGLVAATVPSGGSVPLLEQAIPSAFQYVPERVGIAGSSFAILAENNLNPFRLQPQLAAIVNAATSITPSDLSANAIVSIFGSNLSDTTESAANFTNGAPQILAGGSAVRINNACAGLLLASPGQINAVLPASLMLSGTAQISVVTQASTDCRNGNVSPASTANLVPATPGLFTAQFGKGPVAALHQDGVTPVTPSVPAHQGEYLSVFGTGFGSVKNIPPDRFPSTGADSVTNSVSVLLNGVSLSAADILYAGLAPGIPGLFQLNFHVPDAASVGTLSLQVCISSACSQTGATVDVK